MGPIRPTRIPLQYPEYHATCTYHNITSYIKHATNYISNCHISCNEGIPARYIGNPSHISCNHISCTLVLRPWPTIFLVLHRHHFLDLRRPPYLGFTPLGHHIMSHLVLTMTYSTCSTDAEATSITSLHDLPAGSSHTQTSPTCHRITKVKYTSILYKYRPGEGLYNIHFWIFFELKTIKGSQP